MSNVLDIANFILSKTGSITTMKLQKLCYYSQAWSLVWDDAPLFDEVIEAWANGPVIPELYAKHKGSYKVSNIDGGDANKITPNQQETIEKVITFYNGYNSQQLSDLTHSEDPWKNARKGIPDGIRADVQISLSSMAEYYAGL